MSGYVFAGNATVGSYVDRMLAPLGWQREDAPEDADAIITYFTAGGALEDAYFDTDGFINRAAPKTLLIDLSPATPNFARELASVALVNDLRPVESPLIALDTSIPDAFESPENIACFVAGEQDDIEAARAILEALIGNAQIVGASGAAQLARSALTAQIAAQTVAAIEADALYRAVAKDATMPDMGAGHSGAASPYAAQVLAAVDEERYHGTYTIEMMMGEVTAAMAAADDQELILPQLESTVRLLELLIIIGGVDMSPAGLALLYREEEVVKAAGLDWARAQDYYSTDADLKELRETLESAGIESLFGSSDLFGLDDDDDFGDFDDLDDFDDEDRNDNRFDDYLGGFGGYSAN